MSLDDLALFLGYDYGPTARLKQAMVPKSVNKQDNNDVLEFLGDSILAVIVTVQLVDKNPTLGSGRLTQMRLKYISGENLTLVGKNLELDRLIVTDHGQTSTKVIKDAVEAVIGAVFQDLGMKAAAEFVSGSIMSVIDKGGDAYEANEAALHAKGALQTYSHKTFKGRTPHYTTTVSGGSYTAVVTLHNGRFAQGSGGSAKKAEVEAALVLVRELGLSL